MIICESLQIIDATQYGINCLTVSLDDLITTESVLKFVGLQWSIYTVILAYSWSNYGLKKVKL